MRAIVMLTTLLGAYGAPAGAEDFYLGVQMGAARTDDQAETDSTPAGPIGTSPPAASVNGFPFDSEETSWGALIGWQALPWLAVEVGYRDLGNFGSEPVLVGFLIPGVGGIAFVSQAALDIKESSIGARFSIPIAGRFEGNWFVGLSRVEFDAEGSFPQLSGPIPFPPRPDDFTQIPFASPDSETGLAWGFGFTWKVNRHIGLDLGYRQHDTRVLDIEALAVSVLYAF